MGAFSANLPDTYGASARSFSLAWASAAVYTSLIQASSVPAPSGDYDQNSPRAAWRELVTLEQHLAEECLGPGITLFS
jgi:hypothetical protein